MCHLGYATQKPLPTALGSKIYRPATFKYSSPDKEVLRTTDCCFMMFTPLSQTEARRLNKNSDDHLLPWRSVTISPLSGYVYDIDTFNTLAHWIADSNRKIKRRLASEVLQCIDCRERGLC